MVGVGTKLYQLDSFFSHGADVTEEGLKFFENMLSRIAVQNLEVT
jgi:hypothetical protein